MQLILLYTVIIDIINYADKKVVIFCIAIIKQCNALYIYSCNDINDYCIVKNYIEYHSKSVKLYKIIFKHIQNVFLARLCIQTIYKILFLISHKNSIWSINWLSN